MPCQVDGKSRVLGPGRFGRGEERETLAGAPLHFHHMGDDVNRARMSGIERERAARHPFGAMILAVLLEAERIHRKDAGVAGLGGLPLGQHADDTLPHHAPLAEAEVERVCDDECQNVVRPVDDDGAVAFGRERLIAREPGPRGGRVTVRWRALLRVRRFDGGHARGQHGPRCVVVGTHDERGAQTVAEHALGIVGKHPLDLGGRIPAMGEHELERVLASPE
jgi:hypothetical protein